MFSVADINSFVSMIKEEKTYDSAVDGGIRDTPRARDNKPTQSRIMCSSKGLGPAKEASKIRFPVNRPPLHVVCKNPPSWNKLERRT